MKNLLMSIANAIALLPSIFFASQPVLRSLKIYLSFFYSLAHVDTVSFYFCSILSNFCMHYENITLNRRKFAAKKESNTEKENEIHTEDIGCVIPISLRKSLYNNPTVSCCSMITFDKVAASI